MANQDGLLCVASEWAEAIQRSCPIWSQPLKVDFSWLKSSTSDVTPQRPDGISEPGAAEMTTGGRSSPDYTCEKPNLSKEITSLGARSSGILSRELVLPAKI